MNVVKAPQGHLPAAGEGVGPNNCAAPREMRVGATATAVAVAVGAVVVVMGVRHMQLPLYVRVLLKVLSLVGGALLATGAFLGLLVLKGWWEDLVSQQRPMRRRYSGPCGPCDQTMEGLFT